MAKITNWALNLTKWGNNYANNMANHDYDSQDDHYDDPNKCDYKDKYYHYD